LSSVGQAYLDGLAAAAISPPTITAPEAGASSKPTLASSLTVDNRCDGIDDIDNASTVLAPGEIQSMMWQGKRLAKNAYRIGLPVQLVAELQLYANRMGITDYYHNLLVDNQPLMQGTQRKVIFNCDGDAQKQENRNWLVQRPMQHWCSNMHWASPADKPAHDEYLSVLSAGGFDRVLESIGSHFDHIEALSAYHLSYIGVSHCEKGFIHADVNDSGRMAFNLIIPLMLKTDAGSELEVLADEDINDRDNGTKVSSVNGDFHKSFYKYRINAASMVGDGALHATAACDYRGHANNTASGGMRLAATVYVGDITPANVNQLLMSLTQAYPPPGDAQYLLEQAGQHWSRSDPCKRLPMQRRN